MKGGKKGKEEGGKVGGRWGEGWVGEYRGAAQRGQPPSPRDSPILYTMFTGLVQTVATVASVQQTPAGRAITIDPASWAHSPAPGDSIALAGVCLTVTSPPPHTPTSAPTSAPPSIRFDVITETLNRSTLGDLTEGSKINLEHAATPSTLMGGHIVQGHVDTVATVAAVEPNPADYRITLSIDPHYMPAIVPKGCITIDGVSLTIADTNPKDHTATVALIPTTLECTTLSELTPGARCNIETDIVARTVLNYIQHYAPLHSD